MSRCGYRGLAFPSDTSPGLVTVLDHSGQEIASGAERAAIAEMASRAQSLRDRMESVGTELTETVFGSRVTVRWFRTEDACRADLSARTEFLRTVGRA